MFSFGLDSVIVYRRLYFPGKGAFVQGFTA
jgi:hypothetical protein